MTMHDASRTSYLGLIRLQKLAKARHELELSRLNAKQAAIKEENDALFRMQEDRFVVGATAFVPVPIILKRLETNKSLQAQLSEHMVEAKRNLLKASRTLDTLESRLRDLAKTISRAEVADEADEYMGHLLGRHAI
ncbi:hypothetical protein [Phyllobacterium bourgognense]|uniref:Flagellar export protein FliJ n=1 Tax=Phyllobacterium bourgognense TaxID=314236 RepID=A0A368YRN5_9HYPH|nr:hypothetical protein [Phyllobacterium bourgognense]RCW82248.1 hypothetical protein C7476_10862 [Phyllobacterium bourgognense]